MQSILEFLQLVYDFLASNNTVIPFVYVFPIVQVLSVKRWQNGLSIVLKGYAEEESVGSIPVLLF